MAVHAAEPPGRKELGTNVQRGAPKQGCTSTPTRRPEYPPRRPCPGLTPVLDVDPWIWVCQGARLAQSQMKPGVPEGCIWSESGGGAHGQLFGEQDLEL